MPTKIAWKFPPRQKLAVNKENLAIFSPMSLIMLRKSEGSSDISGIQFVMSRLNPGLQDWQVTPSVQALHEAGQSKQICLLTQVRKEFLTYTG